VISDNHSYRSGAAQESGQESGDIILFSRNPRIRGHHTDFARWYWLRGRDLVLGADSV
jgi:hypothetical protein